MLCVLQRLDSAIVLDRDYQYQYFGFKVTLGTPHSSSTKNQNVGCATDFVLQIAATTSAHAFWKGCNNRIMFVLLVKLFAFEICRSPNVWKKVFGALVTVFFFFIWRCFAKFALCDLLWQLLGLDVLNFLLPTWVNVSSQNKRWLFLCVFQTLERSYLLRLNGKGEMLNDGVD